MIFVSTCFGIGGLVVAVHLGVILQKEEQEEQDMIYNVGDKVRIKSKKQFYDENKDKNNVNILSYSILK